MVEIKVIDPVKINNQFAVFSTYSDDPIFNNEIISVDSPIFCAGKITNIEQNVYNFNKNDLVAYISLKQNLNIEISSNLILKLNNNRNQKLIALIPYASFAMKILREINPKIGQNILIIGLNFFSILLLKIFKLAGSDPLIINLDVDSTNIKKKKKTHKWIINGFKEAKILLRNIKIDSIVIYPSLRKNLDDFLKEIKYSKVILLNEISIYDKGLLDVNYIRGIKYPYSYVRWDFKNNLSYFINLFERGILNLDFLDYKLLEVDSIKEISEIINCLQSKSLILFSII